MNLKYLRFKIWSLVNQEILTFVHNISNFLPSAFNNYHETLASFHGINTRHGSNLIFLSFLLIKTVFTIFLQIYKVTNILHILVIG